MTKEPSPVNPLVELTDDEQKEIEKAAATLAWFRDALGRPFEQYAEKLVRTYFDWWLNERTQWHEARLEAKIDQLLARVELAIQQGGNIMTEIDDLNAAVAKLTTAVSDGAAELRRLAQLIIDNATNVAALETAAQQISGQADALEAAVAEAPEVPPAPPAPL